MAEELRRSVEAHRAERVRELAAALSDTLGIAAAELELEPAAALEHAQSAMCIASWHAENPSRVYAIGALSCAQAAADLMSPPAAGALLAAMRAAGVQNK